MEYNYLHTTEDLYDDYRSRGILAFRKLPPTRAGCIQLLNLLHEKSCFCDREVYRYLLTEYDKFLSMKDLSHLMENLDSFDEEIVALISRVKREMEFEVKEVL